MGKILKITNEDQEIKIFDIDGKCEIMIQTDDMDNSTSTIWLTKKNIISIYEYLGKMIEKF